MNQRGLPRLQRIGAVRQVMRGEALKHRAGSGAQIQVIGQSHDARGRSERVLGVSTEDHRVGHAVTDLEVRHAAANVADHACGFGAVSERKRSFHAPDSILHVQVVQAGGRDLDENLAGSGLRNVDVLVLHYLWPAQGVDSNSFHDWFSSRSSV